MLNRLVINMTEIELVAKIKHWETELAHLVDTYNDPLEALEWLDLYRTEHRRRFPSITFRWRQ